MQYCVKCHIKVRGHKRCCPLCQGPLSGEAEEGAFPAIPQPKISRLSFFRVCTFLMLTIETAFLICFYMRQAAWILWTMGFVLLGWADIWITMYFRHNVIKLVHMQFFIGIVLMLVLKATGKLGVSSDWIWIWLFPACVLTLAITTIMVGKLSRIPFETYAIYLIWDIVFSFLQLIPLFMKLNPMPLPALVSMGLMALLAAAFLLFKPKETKRASRKWFRF